LLPNLMLCFRFDSSACFLMSSSAIVASSSVR
jgi:hypothetical protein